MTKQLLIATLLTTTTLACGGRQSPYDSTTIAFGTLEDAIPEDATYAMYVNLNAETYEAAMQSVNQSGSSQVWSQWLGVESTGDIFADMGFDTDGGYAVFSRDLSPILLARLNDGARWDNTIDSVINQNPDLAWSQRSVVGTTFDFAMTPDGPLLLGTRGDYAVVRFGIGEEDLDTATADLEALFYGSEEVGRFEDSEVFSTLASRAGDGEALYSYVFAEPATLSRLFSTIKTAASEHGASTPFPTGAPTAAGTQDDVCVEAEERITTNYNWIGAASFLTPGELLSSRSEVLVDLSLAHAERLEELFGGAVILNEATTDDTAIYVSGHADLRGIVNSFTASPEASSCAGLAMIPGVAAMLAQSMRPTIDYNLEFFDGDFAFALVDVEMAGFLPFVHGALMLGSPNPAALATQIGRQLEAQGATVTPTMGPSGPIFQYRLVHLRINTYILEDRMVMVIGNVPEAITAQLSTAPLGAPGVPFGSFNWNGERMRNLIDIGLQFAEASGTFSAEQLEEINTGLAGIRAIDTMSGAAHFDGNLLVLEMLQRLSAGQQ